VKLTPRQVTDLDPTRGGEHQQPDDVDILAGAFHAPPNLPQLAIGQDAGAGAALLRLVGEAHRVDLDQALPCQPRKISAETSAGALGGGRSAFGRKAGNEGGHRSAVNLAHWAVMQRLGVLAQMPLSFAIAEWPQLRSLEGEVAGEQHAERLDRPRSDLLLL